MHKRASVLLAALLLLSASARAQGNLGGAAGLSNSIFKLMNQVGAPAAPATGTSARTPPAAPAPATLTFRASKQVRQQVIRTFVQQISDASPEVGAELEKTFKTTDIFTEIEKEERRLFGQTMSVNNVADVWATYWGYAWLMTRSRTDDPTPRQMQGLRTQFQGLLLGLPDLVKMTEAQKQEMSDTLTLQVLLFGILADAWKEDQESLAQFGQQLGDTARQMGFDLNRLDLTDAGFVVQK